QRILDQLRAGQVPDYRHLLDGFAIQNNPDGPEIGIDIGFEGNGHAGPITTPSGIPLVGDITVFDGEGHVNIQSELDFELHDPNNDGKLRLDEIAAITDNFSDLSKLFCAFDEHFSSSVDVGGSATVLDQTVSANDMGLSTGNCNLRDLLNVLF